MENLYRNFKQELGYVDATNQYIEMSSRYFTKEHSSELSEEAGIKRMAKNVSLSVSALPDDFQQRMARNYIMSVHSCIEHFLIAFRDMPGTPTYRENYNADEDNRLHWTLRKIYGTIPEEVRALYYVCDYYRLVRNNIVHFGKDELVGNIKTAYNNACTIHSDFLYSGMSAKLNAPSELRNLNFDDQILFSRSARSLVEHMVYDSKYDLEEIVDRNIVDILFKTRKFVNNPESMRRVITDYLKRYYVIVNADDSMWRNVIEKISNYSEEE